MDAKLICTAHALYAKSNASQKRSMGRNLRTHKLHFEVMLSIPYLAAVSNLFQILHIREYFDAKGQLHWSVIDKRCMQYYVRRTAEATPGGDQRRS